MEQLPPPRRFAILAVCTANICRSPLMEMLLRARLDEARFEVASAGTHGWVDEPMDAMAAMEALRLGHDPTEFRSHPLDEYFVNNAGLIVTATRQHRAFVLELVPSALRRTFTLLEFADLVIRVDAETLPELVAVAAQQRGSGRSATGVDVRDPYRRSPKIHQETADEIDAACEVIAARLTEVADRALALPPPPTS